MKNSTNTPKKPTFHLENHSLYNKNPFPVFILITHEDKKIKSFSAFINLGKQKRPSGMPPGLFCFPTGTQKCPRAI